MTIRRFANLPFVLLRRRTWFIAAFQSGLVVGSLALAWMLRFDFFVPYRLLLVYVALVLLPTRLLAFAKFRLLHGWWQYTGINDAKDIAKATLAGTLLFWLVMYFSPGTAGFPRSVYVLESILSGMSLAGVRVLSRAIAESVHKDPAWGKRIILIGAGFAAQMILREITRPGSSYHPVGCVDDDPSKHGLKLHGVPVLGTVDELGAILQQHPADEVLIAVPCATGEQMRRFVRICEQARIKFKTIPTLRDLISGKVSVSQARDVSLEDLLGREPVQI